MRIFVTGASGFVGGRLTKQWAQEYEIWALSRSDASATKVETLGAKAIRGDLKTVVIEDMAGCDAVVHCAAFARPWGAREEFFDSNVMGTKHLLEIAEAAGVKHFIFISTESVLFVGQSLVDVDETTPYPSKYNNHYGESKAVAEKLVLEANKPGFRTIALRASWVWGPGDTNALPMIIDFIEQGKFMWMDHGNAHKSTTHVDNLIYAIGLTLKSDQGGEVYFINDGPKISLKSFITQAVATRGMTVPDKNFPGAIARPLATVIEGSWKFLGRTDKPPMTILEVGFFTAETTFSIAKAQRELGYSPIVERDEGLAQLANGGQDANKK
ncbi:MAG: NAD-dependent epimerase/dehydratase family protein [Chloroflexota bacterium]